MYIYIYIYLYLYVYIYIHIYIHIYLKVVEHEGRNGACQHQRVLPVQPCICVCVCVCVCVSMYCAHIRTEYGCMHVCGYARARTHTAQHRECWCGPDESIHTHKHTHKHTPCMLVWARRDISRMVLVSCLGFSHASLVHIHTYASSNSQYL